MAMPKIMKAFIVAATSLAVLPRIVWAHHFMGGGLPETFAQGLLSGFGHPVIGPDHAVFIVAAGFFLALVEGGMWGVLALIAGSLFGAALHLTGFSLPGGEIGVALSVILIGGLLMARRRIRLSWLATGLALAGILGQVEFRFGDGSKHLLGPGGLVRVAPGTHRGMRNVGQTDAVVVVAGGKDGYVGRDGQQVSSGTGRSPIERSDSGRGPIEA